MKKILYALQLAIVMMLAVPQQAWAEASDVLKQKMNFTVMPKGNGVFTVKVPVYVGARGGNRWAVNPSDNSSLHNRILIACDKDTFQLVTFYASNWDNDDSGHRTVRVTVDSEHKNLGICTFAQYDGSSKELESVGNWNDVESAISKDIKQEYNTVYLEFDFKASYTLFNGKKIKFIVDAWYDARARDEVEYKYDMATYEYTSTLLPPSIAGAYLNPSPAEGKEGQVKLIGYSISTPETVEVLSNGESLASYNNCSSGSMEIMLDQSDDTRIVVLRATYKDDNTTVTLDSKPFTVLPYHSIENLKAVELHEATPKVSSGNKKLTWSIDVAPGSSLTDMYASDKFIIERSYYSDMSNAVQVGTVSMNDSVTFGKYTFTDNSDMAAYNSVNGTYNYYRVRRASAQAFYSTTTNLFAVVTSAANNVAALPKVTSITTTKDTNFKQNHKVTVTSKLSLGKFVNYDYSTGVDYYYAHWNDEAKLKLAILRNDYDGVALPTDTLEFSSDAITYDETQGAYFATKEVVLNEVATYYNFSSWVEIPESATSYLRFATYSNKDKDAGQTTTSNICYTDVPYITNVKATEGTEYGFVRITWDMPTSKLTRMELTRKEIGKDGSTSIGVLDQSINYYEDHTAELGKKYEYIVSSYVKYANSESYKHSDAADDYVPVYGFISPVGKITGKAVTSEGVGIGGQPIKVSDASGNSVAETKTADDGTFAVGNLPINNEGVKYQVVAADEHLEFVDKNGDKVTEVGMDAHNSLAEGLKFTCSTVQRFAGRVLYENSTVPVAGATFRINGCLVHTANGDVLKSDQLGNFEFYVPQCPVTVQVCKKGHRFDQDGYILDVHNDQRQFTPTEPYLGLTIYDKTKVLLHGRVIGGNTLAAQPLGQNLTENNLGDDITLQMKLEGNNTADIVYLQNQKDKDTLKVNNIQMWQGKEAVNTTAIFGRKQITINVDNRTGEYAMEVFPTKYKITQAYAQGYASLFTKGEVAQVIDLTDSVAADSMQTTTAVYSITYHSDVDITYQQLLWGATEVKYLGSEQMYDTNLHNTIVNTSLAWVDKNDSVNYLLGYPLFETGTRYFLRGTAHEDYYYNGDTRKGKHYVEVIRNGEAKVENGLAGISPETQTYTLDDNGQFTVNFVADNDQFSATGEDALRQLYSSVLVNGYYYQSTPIKAFVTGVRDKDGEVFTSKNANIQLLDVLRDPPGASSYSYYGAGKKYEMTRKFKFSVDTSVKFDIKSGTNYTAVVGTYNGSLLGSAGAFIGSTTSGSTAFSTSISIPLISFSAKRTATYHFTSNERIQTSDDPKDVGAMADVYIGATTDYITKVKQTICVIDDSTYQAVLPSIKAGVIKLLTQGKNVDGSMRYLVIAEKLDIGADMPSTFVYSQSHILKSVIPQLMVERSQLLYGGNGVTKDDVQSMATKQNKILYYYKGEKNDSTYLVDYEPVFPKGEQPKVFTDDIKLYNNQILRWIEMIGYNEKLKVVAAATRQGDSKTYSISGNQKVAYSEEIEYYQNVESGSDKDATLFGLGWSDLKDGLDGAKANQFVNKMSDMFFGDYLGSNDLKEGGEKRAMTDKEKQDFMNSLTSLISDNASSKDKLTTTDISTPSVKTTIQWTPVVNFDMGDDTDKTTLTTCESGYEMKVDDDSYLNVTVFKTPADSCSGFAALKSAMTYATSNDSNTDYLHEYVFYVNGGATRNPWIDADSTLVYITGTKLGARTSKIDNPVLTILNPEVSNVAKGEKAVFKLQLTNDSELTGNQTVTHPSEFTLSLVDESNENGAKISMDGMPLTDGRTFTIEPKATLNKTLEVEQGEGYDFDGLQLELACKSDDNVSSKATFSVHYLPSSSPVNISTPTDKWVMNTNSSNDTAGYYLPVVIDGYDIHYKNFDHIELQYKKSTEGENGWVNLCSFYENDSLYQAASGTKSIEQTAKGRITYAFYGEKDPVEMKYDLRAVTFCRLGTGYVSQASNVISGTKDTRRPVVFGQPQPTNGILTNENSIILPFSENIAYNYLDETSNFDVRGYLNNTSDFDTNAGLEFPGTESQEAYTKVTRNLANRDFTIDMLVWPSKENKEMTFFSHGEQSQGDMFLFGITESRKLFVNLNGRFIYSEPLKTTYNQDYTHMGVVFKRVADADEEGLGEVRFFVGNSFINSEEPASQTRDAYYGNSQIYLGSNPVSNVTAPFEGRMLEVRLWNQALDEEMISEYNHQTLDGYTQRLIARWPLRQTNGPTATDEANGADLCLAGTSWFTARGHSLKMEHKSFALDGSVFHRSSNLDYTLGFWMKVNEVKDKAEIFSAGDDNLSEKGMGKLRLGFEGGNFRVISNDITTNLSAQNEVANDAWHYFAMSVSHSKNIANFYLDNTLVAQLEGDSVDGISNMDVRLGSQNLSACVDLLTLWHQALPQDYLDRIMNYRQSGDEMGLQVYLPFDEPKESSQGQLDNRFSVCNMATENQDIYKQSMLTGVDETTDVYEQNAPVLNSLQMKKLKFSWSSDGTNLLINLDMKDSEINNQNIYLTVRDVEDQNGNTMANPYTWVIYAHRNILDFVEKTAKCTVKQGQTVMGEVNWANATSNSPNYTITTSSDFIVTDLTKGVAEPNSSSPLTFRIKEGMTPGEYIEYIWLHDDDNNMTSTLQLNITVEADEPTWAVDRTKYDQTMTLIGQVHKKMANYVALDNDERDVIGVFAGSECVGVGSISNEKNLTRLYLTIYGNKSLTAQPLTFYLWDYTEGGVKMLKADSTIHFYPDAIVGMPPADPVSLTTADGVIQDINLTEGWNWVSLNITPNNATSANALFFTSDVFTNQDLIKDDASHVEYVASRKKWLGNNMTFQNSKVYHIYMHNAAKVSIVGTELTDDKRVLHVTKGWNELPYLLDQETSVDRAMTDFSLGDKAVEGDILKGLDGFATLTTGHNWVGSLVTLKPNTGYYLYHTGTDCDIDFSKVSLSSVKAQSALLNESDEAVSVVAEGASSTNAVRGIRRSENNMPVIAALADGEDWPEDAIVKAYAGAELVGEATPVTLSDGTKRYFITVAQSDQNIHFVIEQEDEEPVTVGSLPYNSATCIGTLKAPYLLSTKNVETSDSQLYDLSGRQLNNSAKQPAGVYIKNGIKQVIK